MRSFPIRGATRVLGGIVLTAFAPWYAQAQFEPPTLPPAQLTPPVERALPIPAAPPAQPTPGQASPGQASPESIPPAPPAPPAANVPVPTRPDAPPVQPGEMIFQVSAPFSKLQLRVLDTRVLELGNRIKFVDGFDQDKITVVPLSPHRVRVRAEKPGVTSVKLIDEFDNTHNIEIFSQPDTRELQAYLERLFPETAIEVIGIRDGVVLRGWVTKPSEIPEIMAISEQFYPVVQPQLTVSGPSQVQLHVKVIEVQRTKLRELGFNFLLIGQQFYAYNGVGSLAPLSSAELPFGGPPSVTVGGSAFTNSNFQFAITGNNNIFQGFLHALQQEQLAKVLAEPVLVTTSGRPATVHSGGEFPVPVPQGFGNLSITWKEIGIKLEAVPIILGNGRLRLDLAPEVSERDYGNTVSINGQVVPGIASRSVNTQVEMRFGETLMIGGLISSRKQGTTHKVPFLGELPWIGAAFSRKSFQVGETELVILVTPQMVSPMKAWEVPPGGPGLNSSDPTMRELFLDGNLEVPVFGPECPGGNCPPSNQLIPPPMVPIQAPLNEPTPAPAPSVTSRTPAAAASPRGEIQQTSGVMPNSPPRQKTTTSNPFQSTEIKPSREKTSTMHSFSGIGETRSTTTEVQPRSTPAPGKRELPGLIEPR